MSISASGKKESINVCVETEGLTLPSLTLPSFSSFFLSISFSFRLLGFNLLTVYNRAKMSAIRIGGRMLVPPHQERSNPPVVNADVLKECLTQTCDDSQPKAMSPPHESSSRQHQSQQTHPLPSQPQSLDSVVVVGEVSPMSPPDKVVVVHESPPEEASKVTTP